MQVCTFISSSFMSMSSPLLQCHICVSSYNIHIRIFKYCKFDSKCQLFVVLEVSSTDIYIYSYYFKIVSSLMSYLGKIIMTSNSIK